jgi:poly-gamma-glutamate synthesis protein (capsule biosynthesis protein)
MTGRGIDQVLPHRVEPALYEPYVRDARQYVALAEQENGPIPAPVGFDYIWGDALTELKRRSPDALILNLETSITTSDDADPSKGIHYRMHPDNIKCLMRVGADCCVLANNHVLDWGHKGLIETLVTLRKAPIRTAGAGRTATEAKQPAVVDSTASARVLVFAYGSTTSGIPETWAAGKHQAGVNLLRDLSNRTLREVAAHIRAHSKAGDIVIFSVHWGSNWGYSVPREQVEFAHGLIDEAGVDIIHGHSSHHPRPIEVHNGRLILYGCGDFLNDYEGISGQEKYRGDLSLMYFPQVEVGGALVGLEMVPLQMRQFRLQRAEADDALWLRDTLNRISHRSGTHIELRDNGHLSLLMNPGRGGALP